MKILQVFDFLSLPHGGGTVDIVYSLSRALSKRGHDVTVCIGDYELDRKYLDALRKVEKKVFHSWLNYHGFFIMPSLIGLDITEYDVIHLHCYRSFQNAVICAKARKHNVPYILDAHGSTVELLGKKQLIRKLYDWVFGYKSLKYASLVIAETEIGISEYKKLGVESHKEVLLHPLLDTEEFTTLPEVGLFRAKYKIRERYIVLFVGRIHWAKGIEVLLNAARRLKDTRLVIVGQDDGHKAFLGNIISENRLNKKVLFTGFLSGENKLSALVDADVLVQPSMNEAGIRPSLEAILCDTPVIVTRNTGAGKAIDKFNGGYLVEYGDARELAITIRDIFRNYPEAQAKTARAKEYIRDNLSFDKQIIKYEKLYGVVV